MEKNFDNIKSNGIKAIPNILQVLVICLSFIVVVFQFSRYMYDMQWFGYWGIDKSFYTQNSINLTNNLIYIVYVLLLLVFFAIEVYKNMNNRHCNFFHWLKIVFFYILSCILLTPDIFYKENFSINYFLQNILGLIGSFILMIFYTRQVTKFINKFKDADYVFMFYKDLFQDLFIIFIAIVTSIIILGNINVNLNKKYQIIDNEIDIDYVILYSCSDYYIVANCQLENNKLVVFKDTVKKIDNHNIMSHWETFDKIIKK